jgi:hypothetical protein
MTQMHIQRILSLVQVVVWIIFLALTVGRNRQWRLVPDWLRAASSSNFLWIAVCTIGLLACALRLILR